jgi:hypothetical protein
MATVARKPVHRGERAISRKTIAQGRPDASAEPVCSCARFCAVLHTRPRVQRAPGFPCALFFWGETFLSRPGRIAPRECGGAFGRHCEPTGRANARPMTGSAKQSISPGKVRMDCFVASLLAMTWTGQCYPVPPTGRPNGRLTTGFGRTIQYSRDIHVRTEKPQRTGCPAFAGMTSNR